MTDSREQRAEEKKDFRTIRIEMPGKTFEGMRGMMSGFRRATAAESGCCGPGSGMCCPRPEEENEFTFTISIKRKE